MKLYLNTLLGFAVLTLAIQERAEEVRSDCSFQKPLQLVNASDFSIRTKDHSDKICVTMSFCAHNAKPGESVGLIPLEYSRVMACMPENGKCSKSYDKCESDGGLEFIDEVAGAKQIQNFVHPKKISK